MACTCFNVFITGTLVYLRILSFEVAIKLNRTFETRYEKMVPWQQ